MSNTTTFKRRYDAVVIGARCAGASVAMLLARAGANVLCVDRQQYRSDVASTHALMRSGVLQLDRWGVLPTLMADGTPAVRETSFHYGAETAHIDIKPEYGVDYLCAPRRTVLDRVLVDAAAAAGVDIRHGVTLADLTRAADGRVTGVVLKDANGAVQEITAGIVIGADGRQSTVARLVDAPVYVAGSHASGYVYGYFRGMAAPGYHWYFEDHAAAGVIPTNGNQHCVFVGVPQDQFAPTFKGNLEAGFLTVAAANSPALRTAITAAQPAGRLRGFAGGTGYLRQSHGPGWALVGDAGYFKDPLTAHGISDALRDAELLARAVLGGGGRALARYQDERDTYGRPFLEVTDTIASFSWDLDTVKVHHRRLSDLMKEETARVAAFSTPQPLAA